MRPQAVAQVEFTPLFDWSPPRRRKLAIVSFIAGSAALHALCFYLFQVIYPPTVALLPPPARVNLITPDSDSGRVLLRWIESEDPALLSSAQRPPDSASIPLPEATYVPSYANWVPALRMPSLLPSPPAIPSSQPPGPVPISRAAPPTDVPVTPTTVQFAHDSGALGQPQVPALQFTATRTEPPQAAEFRVAINDNGEVRHCFLQTSSGDSSLDAQARRALLATRFTSMKTTAVDLGERLVWTTATIEWGNDIAPPAPAASASPKS